MKIKTLLITLLLILQGGLLFSQCISIELSITWAMEYDIFQKDSTISVPTLNIIYRNNCETNYYFFKVSPRKDSMLSLVTCTVLFQHHNPIDYLARATHYRNYANQNFNVIMGHNPWYNAGWEVHSDPVGYHEDYSSVSISCDLQNIYDYIYLINYNNYEIPRDYLIAPLDVITPEQITSDFVKNQFVFLKHGEIHIDTYNLIGFKLVEGCFTFLIAKDEIENHVIGIQTDSISSQIMYPKLELPAIVGEYQLYSGAFNTNKVTVCFGDK